MGRKRQRSNGEDANVDMTPMIDVVFQLIIFFVVTITMADAKDESIRLELAPDGEEVESASDNPEAATSITIDVNRNGRMSISNVTMSEKQLRDVIERRKRKFGDTFEVWIRGDALATHTHIRKAMDVCADCGIARVSFLAVKDTRTKEQKQFFSGKQYRGMKGRMDRR